MPHHTRRACAALAAAVVLLSARPVAAQVQQLPDLSLEELMRIGIKRVFGASERLQPVTEAPSSVTIVTRDEIARYGHRTLGDVLRSVRGFYVSEDRNYSYVGARGFARAGDYNTRVLLLVNGHRVNDNVYDQASVGPEFGLDVAMIERVEVIRGPASALYGTSAFFAVVNVVTRDGASIDGASVQVETGSLGTGILRALAGRRLSNGVDVAVGTSLDRSDGVDRLYFPAYDTPEANHGIAVGLDGERNRSLYGRVSFRELTVTAAWGDRQKDIPTASFGTIFNAQDPTERTLDMHSFVDARYERTMGPARAAFRLAYDRGTYKGRYPYPSWDDEPGYVEHDGYLGTRLSTDAKVSTTMFALQTLTAGGEFIKNLDQDQWAGPEGGPYYMDRDDSSTQHALFLQDEVKLRPWLLVNAGLRHDTYGTFSRTSPRGAVILMPSANQSFKYLYGRAFRAPNEYEQHYYTPIADLAPESIVTHELVWERYVGEWLRTSASSYWYETSNLISLTTVDGFSGDLGFVNDAGRVEARGVELEGEVRTAQGVQGFASYVWQRAQYQGTGTLLTNSPRHLAAARLSVPGFTPRSSVAVDVRYLSGRKTLQGGEAAAHAVTNVTVVAPVGRAVELTAAVRNLFDVRYADPASGEHMQEVLEQNGRTFRVGLRWTLGRR